MTASSATADHGRGANGSPRDTRTERNEPLLLPRREFLKLLGVAAGALGAGGCGRWAIPEHLVERALRGPGLETFEQSICGMCESGCGLTVRLVDGLPVGLKGNPHHPLNRGGLCAVGQAGLEVLYSPDRLRGPLRREAGGDLRPVTWDQALGEIAGRLAELAADGAGHRVALLTEEPGRLFGDLARRFTLALGSPGFARLADLSALPFFLTQGLDEPPGFDLARADLVLSFGLDLYEEGPAPLHAISALVGSREAERLGRLLYVGTRLSPSAAKAERYVAIRPGTHAAFALGVGSVLVREGRYDRDFVAEHTFGFEDWTDDGGRPRRGFRRLLLERFYPDRVASLCGCEPARIVDVARRFSGAETPLAITGGTATAASNGTTTGIAVHALNALAGAFGRPGGVVLPPPIALTPLPALAAAATQATSVFTPHSGGGLFGADPVASLAERVLGDPGCVEVLFVVAADPVHDSVAGERLREAMERIPMVVVLAPFRDQTASAADYLLPTHVDLERWQAATTPPAVAFSTLGLGSPVVQPLYDTRESGDLLLELARRAGGTASAALPWATYADYLRHRLGGLVVSGQGSVVTGSFEESWIHFLEERGWRFLERKSLDDFWSDLEREAAWWDPAQARGDWKLLFRTPSGRFEFFSQTLERRLREIGRTGGEPTGDEQELARGIAAAGLEPIGDEACLPRYEPPRESGEGELVLLPFRPITARGRLGVASPMVLEMFGYPVYTAWKTWAELAPDTAHELGVEDGDEIEVRSDRRAVEAVVRLQPGATPGTVHLPLGLGRGEGYGAAGSVGANPLTQLLTERDLLAGTLSLTSTRVAVKLLRRRRRGGPAPAGGHA